MFNYKFEYFDTSDGDQQKVDMGTFIKEFSNIQITNNEELYIFLTETLDWGKTFRLIIISAFLQI